MWTKLMLDGIQKRSGSLTSSSAGGVGAASSSHDSCINRVENHKIRNENPLSTRLKATLHVYYHYEILFDLGRVINSPEKASETI